MQAHTSSRASQAAALANARDSGSIPGLERSPEEGNGNPLQYFCLGNPMDRGASWAVVHGVAESDTTEQLRTELKGIRASQVAQQ